MSNWLVPYFTFNGNCEEAVNFYRQVLGGEVQLMHYGDAAPNPKFTVPDHVKHLDISAKIGCVCT